MLRAILNKSWRQHPTRHQLYGQLPSITKLSKLDELDMQDTAGEAGTSIMGMVHIYIYIIIYIYIENVWKFVNEELRKRIQETSKNYGLIWKENVRISVDECKTLIHSCSKRCQVVIESKVLYIKYWWIMNAIFISIQCIYHKRMIFLIVLMFLIVCYFRMLNDSSYNFIFKNFIELYILELNDF